MLLDLLSDPAGLNGVPDPSLNAYMKSQSDKVRFVGTAIGNVVSHEAGHFLGSFHVDQFNTVLNLMDQGGNFPFSTASVLTASVAPPTTATSISAATPTTRSKASSDPRTRPPTRSGDSRRYGTDLLAKRGPTEADPRNASASARQWRLLLAVEMSVAAGQLKSAVTVAADVGSHPMPCAEPTNRAAALVCPQFCTDGLHDARAARRGSSSSRPEYAHGRVRVSRLCAGLPLAGDLPGERRTRREGRNDAASERSREQELLLRVRYSCEHGRHSVVVLSRVAEVRHEGDPTDCVTEWSGRNRTASTRVALRGPKARPSGTVSFGLTL